MDCANCGRANRSSARFCDGCGRPLAARRADEAVARKVVTIVFADLIGSTSLHERLDAESTRRLMDRYYRTLHAAVEAHGGTVVKLLGDGVMAAFGVPRVAEDDAIRAVRAAVGMQNAFRELAHQQTGVSGDIGLRVAVNTGEVVVSADHADVVGDPVNVAARLQQEARDGDVLIGEATRRLVSELVTLAPLGALTLKGRSETVAAYRVVSLDRTAVAATMPFVGRDGELHRLAAVYDAAVATRNARLVVILGSPGLGKSRLIAEFARRVGAGATVLTAHCDAAGGATFAPLADALRAFLHIDDGAGGDGLRAVIDAVVPAGDPERVRITTGVAALIAGTPVLPEETFFVVRRFLAGLAAGQPVVLAIDDLQWAEPLLLDLTEHLVQWSGGVPLFVLVTARPELRDSRASLVVAGGLVADVVTLAGLDAGAATRLAANVIGADELPAAVAGRVLATSEGNPLFVGELVRMLVHDGALKQEGDRWTAGTDLATIEMPPTIHALLAARIERLGPEERTILERAAVVGRNFSRAAVVHLLPREVTDLDARLESLRRSELIESDAGWFLGEPALRFHHSLIRDAAYRRLLKGTRAELHGRFADWLETRVGEAVEHDETIGWHLEQAHQHLRELGAIDEHGRAFGERAAHYLAAAGRRALARDDLPRAASLLGRALDRLDGADPARGDLALDWCEALLAAGDVGPAAGAIDELGRFAGGSQRLRAWHTCFAGQRAVLTDPTALRTTAGAIAAAADELASAGDAAGEAKAHSVHALALARLGEIGACESALDRALAAARRAGDRRRANAVLAGAPLAALWGPSPVTRASGRCLDVVRVLRITQGAPAVEAVALRCQAVLEALRGRSDAARRMIASSRRMVEELGITQALLEADVFAGLIELLEGDAGGAAQTLRAAYDGLRDHGLRIDAARAAALLGRALLAQGQAAEAEALSQESEALAGDDLQAAIAWRGVRAEALAQRDEYAAAVDYARAAVDLAAATDALLHHADARLALAAALRAAGQRDDAEREEARAIELWEAKGATLLAERARGDASSVSHVDRAPEGRVTPAQRGSGRVRANAATANAARLVTAVAARDADAFPTLFGDGMAIVEHPTGVEYGREGLLRSFRSLLSAPDPIFRIESLATVGASLALLRHTVSTSGSAGAEYVSPPEDERIVPPDIGPNESEAIVLLEVDAHGRQRRVEAFAADRLGSAIARLYERYAEILPDGSGRARATATARSVATIVGPFDLDRYATVLAPTIETIDHRTLGLWSTRGAEAFLHALRSLREAADDIATRVDDILGLGPDGLLTMSTLSGTDRVSGGTFRVPHLRLSLFGADGLATRFELFDVDHRDQALTRFDALMDEPAAPRFANAAWQAVQRFERCWRERNWDGVVAAFVPTLVMEDRRALVRLQIAGDDLFTNQRFLFSMKSSQWHSELLATRGQRLVLCRTRFTGEVGDDAQILVEMLSLIEADAGDRYAALVLLDLDDLDAAYAELEDRYANGEGAPHAELLANLRAFERAVAANDPDAARCLLPDDFTAVSHRRFGGTGERMSRDRTLSGLRVMEDLGARGSIRSDHVRISARAAVNLATWSGAVDGGAFETSIVMVIAHDGRRPQSAEVFDPDQLDAAFARFDELSGAALAIRRIENAATRSMHRFEHAWEARDWERVAALTPAGFRNIDRRTMIRLEAGRDQFLESIRPFLAMTVSHLTSETLATRGDRLALFRVRFAGTDRFIGPSEVEWLEVFEVDERGDAAVAVGVDPADLDAAYAELDDRYAAGEAASHLRAAVTRAFSRAFAAREWDDFATLLAPDLVVEDHRLMGWETLHGPAAYIEALKTLVDLAPDVRLRIDHVRMSHPGFLYVTTWVGTHDGGAFETPSVIVSELDGHGRIRRFNQYDLDQLDAARAQLETIGASTAIGPRAALGIPPNAATRAMDRWQERAEAREWTALEGLCAPTCLFDDRRRGSLVTGDRDTFIASSRVIASSGARASRTTLATSGERLALEHVRWMGPENGPPFEVEALCLTEVDAEDRIIAGIAFDLDNRRAASAEMRARSAHSARWVPPAAFEFLRAMNEQDLAGCRAVMSGDFLFHDHRRTGIGRLERADDYLVSLTALFEQVNDLTFETLYNIDTHEHADLAMAHMFGALADGGEFESVYLRLGLYQGDRIVGTELFEPEDLDRARARFEALRPASARSPANPPSPA